MKHGRTVNILLLVAVVALLGVFAFSVRIRPTSDRVAVLTTAGMTCGSCGATVEKGLQRERGVASVEVDVAGGRVVVGYDSQKARPEELASAVTREGYGSRVERVLTAEQFRSVTGRYPGEGITPKTACGCGDGK